MPNSPSYRIRAALRVLAIAVLLSTATSGAAAAAEQPDAQLSITLDSGVDAVADGDALTYTTQIRNSGGAMNARVVLTPPAYIALGETDGATVEQNAATWQVLLAADSTTTLEIPAAVTQIPGDEVRATALVSVYIGDSTAPLIRTAAADPIAGVDDEQVVVPSVATVVLWIGIAVVAILAAVAVALLVLRARRRGSPSATPETESPPGGARPKLPER